MPSLTCIDELKTLREILFKDTDPNQPRLVVCAGTACQASGANGIIRAAKRHIIENRLLGRVSLRVTGCHGFCEMGPFILTEPQQAFYAQVTLADVPKIIDAMLAGGYLEERLYQDSRTGVRYYSRDDIPFFKNQRRSILARNQKIDPIRIHNYIAQGGYEALEKMLAVQQPADVVEEVKRSGLRGRGGAGFSTGLKWELLSKQPSGRGKFLVCNADEGDPGAYMDRSILEGNPHSIIEGMLIGGYATGATDGIVYVRNEYPLAIKNLTVALKQARELGLLGKNILGTDFSFDIEIVRGAGAFVCGEETALIRSIEGKMGEPRQRPPFPIQKGIHGRPTVINNVETWANIPLIITSGAENFARVGVANNSGTKIFSLVGKIKNTGLIEVPMGVSIREIVYDIGGGPPGKQKIKAVQTGGPSGGCIPADQFDLTVDYDSLAKAGSIMGSGGMIVMDENTCMVDVAKYFMGFLKKESCGKCFTCRKGTQRMYEILEDITQGNGTPAHLDLLEELALVVRDSSMCGLGQTAANPVLSTLRYYRHEYERHVNDKRCDAFVCRGLVGAPCQSACPLDTQPWRYIALLEQGRYDEAYAVIRATNPLPSVCARVCDRKCEQRCQMGAGDSHGAIAIRSLKRFITDRVDPAAYTPERRPRAAGAVRKVAVIGGGPAGVVAAHHLSLLGHAVTIFEAGPKLGGMLTSCIPSYRLPRDVVQKELAALIDENITVRCGVALGRDMTLDDLFAQGFSAVFLAMGADKSQQLGLEGEGIKGIYSSMAFLKAFNLRGEELAGGHVGIIGGGNSAVDAARVAMRQDHVESVTLLYRRTDREMPAYAEEVEAALAEGIKLETMVSPVRIRYIETALKEGVKVETGVTAIKIHSHEGHLVGIECIRNEPGPMDAGGRRRPVPIPGTEFRISLNTLIVAIGETPDSDALMPMGVEADKKGRVAVKRGTFMTSREGVFAGGDLVTGPNTVVDAMAAGKKAAHAIDRYLHGETVAETARPILPDMYIGPADVDPAELETAHRAEPPLLPRDHRKKNFREVELAFSAEQAVAEARRCLRCDLEFTQHLNDTALKTAIEEKS
jgi:NADH-quinone oxidoreductase subunit F